MEINKIPPLTRHRSQLMSRCKKQLNPRKHVRLQMPATVAEGKNSVTPTDSHTSAMPNSCLSRAECKQNPYAIRAVRIIQNEFHLSISDTCVCPIVREQSVFDSKISAEPIFNRIFLGKWSFTIFPIATTQPKNLTSKRFGTMWRLQKTKNHQNRSGANRSNEFSKFF